MTRTLNTSRAVPFLVLALLTPALGGPDPKDPAARREIPAYTIPPLKKGVTYQRCIVFGDMGTGSLSQRRVAAAMVKRIKATPGHKIDFMLTTGDNFYPSGVASVTDWQWWWKFELVYFDRRLHVPIYPTLGNHDHQGNVRAQIEYSKQSKRWTMPARYYTFTRTLGKDARGKPLVAQFFALDTERIQWRRNDRAQLAWLARELETSTATWKIAYGHHPLYSHSKRPYNYTMIRRLEPIFVKHGLDLYVAGHDHMLEMLKPVKRVNYVVSGAGGGPSKAYEARWTKRSHYAATRGGFVLLRISKHELVIEFVRMNGKTQYAHTLTRTKRRAQRKRPQRTGKRLGPF